MQQQIGQMRQRGSKIGSRRADKKVGIVMASCRIGGATPAFDDLVKTARRQAGRALENHMLQKMCHAGPSIRLNRSASLHPDINSYNRRSNLLMNQRQPVVKLVVAGRK